MSKAKYVLEIIYVCLALIFASKEMVNSGTSIGKELSKCGVLIEN